MKMNKHTYAHFDTELDALQQRVVMMGEPVCQQVVKAFEGLANIRPTWLNTWRIW